MDRIGRDGTSFENALARTVSRPRAPLLVCAVLAFVVLVAVAIGFVWRQYEAAKDDAAHELRSRAVLAGTVFDTYFAGQLQTLSAMAVAPSVVSGDPDRMQRYFAKFRPDSGTSFTAGVGWIDLTGRQRATSDPNGPVPVSLAGRSYFKEALRTKKPVVGEAIVAQRSRRRLVVMGVPTRDERGRINGVLAGGVVLRASADDARANDLGYTDLEVIDGAGQRVTRRNLARPANGELVTRLRRAREGVLLDTDGLEGSADRVVAFGTSATPGWLTVIDQPASVVYGDARRALLREVLLVSAAAALVLLLFGWAVSRSRRSTLASRAQVARWGQLTHALNEAGEPADVRNALVDALTSEHQAGTAIVGLTADGGDESLAVVVRRGAHSTLADVPDDMAADLAGRVAEADAPVAIDESPRIDAARGVTTLRMGSLYGVPLRYRDGRPAGSATVAFAQPRALGGHELSLLRAYADQVELALDRLRRHEDEHDAAVLLQQSLLPDRLPDVAGVVVATHYRAGALNTRVGGDWYDIVRRPDGVLHLTVGDVAGRGIDAAISMGQLRNAFRAYALEHVSPAAIVDRLARHVPEDEMATVVCVTFDPLTRELTYASAGHLPPLMVDHQQGVVTRLSASHRGPLGWTTSGVVRDASAPVPGVATLALYTDGLVEHRDESIDVGIERLADALLESAELPEEGADAIVAALASDPEDDLALLLVRLAEVPGALELEIPADPHAVRELRRRVHGWLTLRAIDEDTQHAAVLALNEACANAIEHAYRETNGSIVIQLSHRDDVLRIAVEDQGTWRQPTDDPNRGHGILLMRKLMSTADIRQEPGGTRVVLEQKL